MTATPEAAPQASASARVLLPVAGRREVTRELRGAVAERRWWAVGSVVALVIEAVSALLPPIAIGRITQGVVDDRPLSALVVPLVLLAVAAIAGAGGAWAGGVLLARTVLPAVAGLRERVLDTALRLPVDDVESGGLGDLVGRVSGDVDVVTEAAESALANFLGAALALLATLVGLAALDWRLALAGLLAVPVQAHTLRWYLRTSRPLYSLGRRVEGQRTASLLAAFGSLATLRAFRLERRHRDAVEASSIEAMETEFRITNVATRFFGRLNLAEFVGLGAILLVSDVLVRHDELDVGAATTAALFFVTLFDPINTVLGVFDEIQQAGAGLARLVGVTEAERPPAGVTVPTGRPTLVARAVSAGYGAGPDVLHDVDLGVAPGEHVAVVGVTGSGKSTLAGLLTGLRSPRAGTVTLGGVPVGDIVSAELHRHVALVTQETHVFTATLAENVRLGSTKSVTDEAMDEALDDALEAVGATAWIAALPDGVHTQVGHGAHRLTASQAQQLALARLLLIDPAVVVLDEATAEAGSDAARTLDDAAARVLAGRSAVVIAHRLGQARAADRIVVLRDGRVAEAGSHDELVAAGGDYARLWAAWSAS